MNFVRYMLGLDTLEDRIRSLEDRVRTQQNSITALIDLAKTGTKRVIVLNKSLRTLRHEVHRTQNNSY
jgi:uncharacterized coiled-coil protein SlyX